MMLDSSAFETTSRGGDTGPVSGPLPGDAPPLEILVHDARKEYEQLQRELKEIDVLIQQSTGEVDKLARRHASSTSHLRHIQANIETVPRGDIQEAYDAVQDVATAPVHHAWAVGKATERPEKHGAHHELVAALFGIDRRGRSAWRGRG